MSIRPGHVLLTADTVGGVWSYALELIQGLARQSTGTHDTGTTYEVLLATMGKPLSPSQCRAAAQIRNLSIWESRYKLEWMDDPWGDVDASGEWLMERSIDGVSSLFIVSPGKLLGFPLNGTATPERAKLARELPPLLA